MVPDRDGRATNVIVGLTSESEYESVHYAHNNAYLGASVGRFAGRIDGAKFKLNGVEYQLTSRDGVHLHGGNHGFDRKIWRIAEIHHGKDPFVVLEYKSAHLEEGFPGELIVQVTYQVSETNELIVTYKANTSENTIVNLTNHSYFNLKGCGSVVDHLLKIKSQNYLELDAGLIPTGKIKSTLLSYYDFSIPKSIYQTNFDGLDDTFILDASQKQVVLYSEKSGICLTVSTNQPSVVIYTPHSLDHLPIAKPYHNHPFPSICIETQNFPDAPNHASFPSAVLKVGETYINRSVFAFSTRP